MPASGVRLSFGGPLTPVVKILICINAAAYLLMRISAVDAQVVYALLGLRPAQMLADRSYWQLITYMFIHDVSFLHVGMNMLVLWWFGSDVERAWGPKRFTRYYLLAGIFAGLTVAAISSNSLSITIGASGAVMALLIAFATTYPDRTLLFMFIVPMKAKYLVMLIAGLEIFATASAAQDRVSHWAHFGGMAFGLLWFLHFSGRLRPSTWRRVFRRSRRRGRLKLVRSAQEKLDREKAANDNLPPTVH